MNITDALNDASREDACGALEIQKKLRAIAVDILQRPVCVHDSMIAYLLSRIDVAIETDMLTEFAVYVQRFPDWLQQGEEGAGAGWVM